MDCRQMLAVFALLQVGIVVCLARHTHHSIEDELELIVRQLPHEEASDESEALEVRDIDEETNSDIDEETIDGYYYGDSRSKRQNGNGLTQAQKNKIVEKHNTLRKGEGASDMQMLRYSERLGQLAQSWADGCNWGHRPQTSYAARDYGQVSIGENIWAWTGVDLKIIPDKPIQDWFDEKSGFDYNRNFCSRQPCGHYTAVVWAGTKEIGCGLRKCPSLQNSQMRNAYFFVCNYGPAGNMMDEKPFKKGTPCSECGTGQFFCTGGMCDSTCRQAGSGGKCECKSQCQNGTPTPDCKCLCNAGYSGVRCNERCVDKNPQCGASPGWPVQFCDDKSIFGGMLYDQVNEQCPKMCERCK